MIENFIGLVIVLAILVLPFYVGYQLHKHYIEYEPEEDTVDLGIKLLPNFDTQLPLPCYAHKNDSGMDVRAQLPNGFVVIRPQERVIIPTGIAMDIPKDMEIQVRARSGLSLKTDLIVANGIGTIDSGFFAEIGVIIANLGNKPYIVYHGDKIAQLVLSPVLRANLVIKEEFGESERKGNGFGSTGL